MDGPTRNPRAVALLLSFLLLACGGTTWGQAPQSTGLRFTDPSNEPPPPVRLTACDADGPAACDGACGGQCGGAAAPACDGSCGAAKAGDKCQCKRTSCCCGTLVDWSKVPLGIRPMPRPGNFPTPPTGCGYYSFADLLRDQPRLKPQSSGYPSFALMPPSFFDADFRYVEGINPAERTLVERLKRMPLTDCLTFSTGGQFWIRYMDEYNSRLSERNNDYALTRVRMFGDLMYGDRVRLFGEFIWADSLWEDLAPLPIDENRGDILNLFLDLKLFDYDGAPVMARVGRQELLLGSQRLVSTLDWANTRRTFDGARVFRRGEKWDVDVFWTAFVPAQASKLDEWDENREFGGAWVTHRPKPGHFLDFYYMYLENANNQAPLNLPVAPTNVNTFGGRYTGDKNDYLWDVEMALQFGDQANQDLFAGAVTAGVGRHFKDACYNPTAWIYYDYASGDANPNDGDAHTFNQIYPFGHYYLGWLDLVGRQNIHDLNVQMFLYPQHWITVWLQYHHFWLNQGADALYNAGGVPIRRDATGSSGTNVGDEVDVIVNFHLARYSDLLVGYSHLWGGGFLEATSGPNRASDASLFYLMFQQKW